MNSSIPQSRMFRDSPKKNSLGARLFDLLPCAVRTGFRGPDESLSRRAHQALRREKRTSDLCKQYLRLRYPDNLPSVEAFILRIEGSVDSNSNSNWDPFIDLDSMTDETLKPLDLAFAQWLKL